MKEEEEGARKLAKNNNNHQRGARVPLPVTSSERRQQPRITVLHVDDDVIVVNKPCNLRSVPGHANPPPSPSPKEGEEEGRGKAVSSSASRSASPPAGSSSSPNTSKKRARLRFDDSSESSPTSSSISEGNSGPPPHNHSHGRTAQEAWRAAIESIAALAATSSATESSAEGSSSSPSDERDDDDDDDDDDIRLIRALADLPNVSSVPRRLAPFVRFCARNRNRLLLPANGDEKIVSDGHKVGVNAGEEGHRLRQGGAVFFEKIAREAYLRIKAAQEPLLNLPEPTRDDESALGQLRIMGYEKCRHTDPIRVVHRLDCETSGVMVFARNENAARKLSESWRKSGAVKKVYLAMVRTWPPYQQDGLTSGVIDLPLKKSEERLKWEVCDPTDIGAKSSETLWSIYDVTGDADGGGGSVEVAARGGEIGGSSASTAGRRPSGGSGDFGTRSSDGCSSTGAVTLSLRPITGRTHQLRIHCAAMNDGGGIVGDSLYGTDRVRWRGHHHHHGGFGGDDAEEDGGGGGGGQHHHQLRLHAHELSFPHPATDEVVTYTCPKAW